MTNCLLVVVGLLEFILRVVVLIVLVVSIVGLFVLVDVDLQDQTLSEFLTPYCWIVLREALT